MKLRRAMLVLLALSAAALAVIGCAGEEEGTLVIGVAGPHSGDLAPFGLPTVNAAELVVAQINEDGGINGQMVELIVEDDQCTSDGAANTAAKLVSDGAVAIVGHICSGATGAALEIYLESDIVAVSPSSTNPGLAVNDNFFRTIAPDDAQAALQAEFVINEIGASTVAILHDKDDYGKGLADFTKGFLEDAGIEVPVYEGVTVGAVDYSAVINLVDAADVDIVVFGGYHPEASKLVVQMRERGIDVPFMSGDGIYGPSFTELAGDDAEGVYATGAQDTSANPLRQQYEQAHIDEYGEEPGAFFFEGVAATLALLNAIEEAESTEYDAVTAALRSSTVNTPIGPITFDDLGEAAGIGFSVYQVQGGSYAEL